MRFEIILTPSAVASLRDLSAYERAATRDALEVHLRYEPAKVSKSRIKRLRGLIRPQFRLRVNEVRVFYDVIDQEVQILAIVAKAQVEAWLATHGEAQP
jgi:mRNA interferase RelE/StbE